MFNLILVLGQVPGTDFQVTFDELLISLFLIIEAFIAWHYRKRVLYFSRHIKSYALIRKGTQLKLQV